MVDVRDLVDSPGVDLSSTTSNPSTERTPTRRRRRRGPAFDRAASPVALHCDRATTPTGCAPTPTGLKVGGHQASSASMVSIMTALWFGHLTRRRPGVGEAARLACAARHRVPARTSWTPSYLTDAARVRRAAELPEPIEGPDPADYSTGSVGIGATAPIWGAIARRYVGVSERRSAGRQYSLLGDAELDEGACWEAIAGPHGRELGEVVWIVDLNRQSLDRVVPGIGRGPAPGHVRGGRAGRCSSRQVRPHLEELGERPGGDAAAARASTRCPTRSTNGCCVARRRAARTAPAATVDGADAVAGLLSSLTDAAILRRRPEPRRARPRRAERGVRRRSTTPDPTVIFAYTIKGYGLPFEGHPQNHSALLDAREMGELAGRSSASARTARGSRSPEQQPRGRAAATAEAAAAARPVRHAAAARRSRRPRADPGGSATTQSALGRTLHGPDAGRARGGGAAS